jgi:serine/threonine protein kinase
MHSRKVMHLDLKSANILLARDGTAKIADVGLAKILTRDNTHVSMEGTFDWAAPEVTLWPAACTTSPPHTPRCQHLEWMP